jgi:hypothetical protein
VEGGDKTRMKRMREEEAGGGSRRERKKQKSAREAGREERKGGWKGEGGPREQNDTQDFYARSIWIK